MIFHISFTEIWCGCTLSKQSDGLSQDGTNIDAVICLSVHWSHMEELPSVRAFTVNLWVLTPRYPHRLIPPMDQCLLCSSRCQCCTHRIHVTCVILFDLLYSTAGVGPCVGSTKQSSGRKWLTCGKLNTVLQLSSSICCVCKGEKIAMSYMTCSHEPLLSIWFNSLPPGRFE